MLLCSIYRFRHPPRAVVFNLPFSTSVKSGLCLIYRFQHPSIAVVFNLPFSTSVKSCLCLIYRFQHPSRAVCVQFTVFNICQQLLYWNTTQLGLSKGLLLLKVIIEYKIIRYNKFTLLQEHRKQCVFKHKHAYQGRNHLCMRSFNYL